VKYFQTGRNAICQSDSGKSDSESRATSHLFTIIHAVIVFTPPRLSLIIPVIILVSNPYKYSQICSNKAEFSQLPSKLQLQSKLTLCYTVLLCTCMHVMYCRLIHGKQYSNSTPSQNSRILKSVKISCGNVEKNLLVATFGNTMGKGIGRGTHFRQKIQPFRTINSCDTRKGNDLETHNCYFHQSTIN
jgi:hypothetical protein